MAVPTVEDVLRAIDSLYVSTDKEENQKASIWLTELVSTVHVWEIADKLLLLKRDVHTSFFAAQTMQQKIRHCFHELPQDSHQSLKASLMNHLQQLCDAPAPVLRQLAMALVDILIQMGDSNSIIQEVINRYGNSESTACVLLDVLALLPEEIHNRGMRLGLNRRKELTTAFGKEWVIILELLITYLSSLSHNADVTCRIYDCLGSWLAMGNFPVEVLEQSRIIEHVLQVLRRVDVSEKMFESATDCVCAAVYVCENDSYGTFGLSLLKMVIELQPLFLAAIQQEDFMRAQNLSRIFVEMADTFLYHMVHHTDQDVGSLVSLELLLTCVAHHDYEVVGATFNVWYRLAEELSKVNEVDLNNVFQPYIVKLISEVRKHCQIDEDTSPDKVMTDDSEDLVTFRDNVVELVKDVNFIVGAKNLFESLYMSYCEPGVSWNVKESQLLIMYSVASSLHVTESEVLPIALPVLLSISPDTHYAIRATTLKLVGELAAWIDQHPDVMDLVFAFIEAGLKTPVLANAAATAVQKVCLKCKDRLGQRMTGLLEVIQTAYEVGISNDTMLGLLKGVVEVICRQPYQSMYGYLEVLCRHPYVYLQRLATGSNTSSGVRNSSDDPCTWLDRLATMFRSCYLKLKDGEIHPCIEILKICLPLVVKVCYKFKHETRTVERTCRCLRFMLRTFSKGAAPLLDTLIGMCFTIYQEYKHSCFLYLGSIIVDEFGSDVDVHNKLITFLEHMSAATFPLLAVDNDKNGLMLHPDTVDDMFRMCARYLQRCPVAFFKSEVYPIATECAQAATTLNHRDAYASVMKYFRDLILVSQDKSEVIEKEILNAYVVEFLASRGMSLIEGLLRGFLWLPSVMISESAEVLWALILLDREPIVQALRETVEKLPSGKFEVTPQQKEQFISSVSGCQSSEDLQGFIREYSRLFR